MSKQIGQLIKFSQSAMLRLNRIKIISWTFTKLLSFPSFPWKRIHRSARRGKERVTFLRQIHLIKLLWVGQGSILWMLQGQELQTKSLSVYRDSVYSSVSYDRTNVTTTISYHIIKISSLFSKVKTIPRLNPMTYLGLPSNVITVSRKCRHKFLVFVYILHIPSLWGT